jgi:hypothetical protein
VSSDHNLFTFRRDIIPINETHDLCLSPHFRSDDNTAITPILSVGSHFGCGANGCVTLITNHGKHEHTRVVCEYCGYLGDFDGVITTVGQLRLSVQKKHRDGNGAAKPASIPIAAPT